MIEKSNTESDSDQIEEFYEFEQLTQQFKDLLSMGVVLISYL